MDEKVLLDWKEVHADIYSKFKQDWEAQLQKPCHETILELGDNEDADSLQQAMASLASVTSQGNFDIEQLYAKAVEQKDEAAYCLCCYLVFDDGAEQLAKAFKEKAIAFLTNVRKKNGSCFIVWTYGMLGDDMEEYIKDAVNTYKEISGDMRTEYLRLPDCGKELGVRYHPLPSAHEKTAQVLADFLQSLTAYLLR